MPVDDRGKETEVHQVDPEPRTSKRFCLICGDVASCSNYGVLTCYACKRFYEDKVARVTIRLCPAANDCDITGGRRNACQACRFQKCLDMGMAKKRKRSVPLFTNNKPRRTCLKSKTHNTIRRRNTCSLLAVGSVRSLTRDNDGNRTDSATNTKSNLLETVRSTTTHASIKKVRSKGFNRTCEICNKSYPSLSLFVLHKSCYNIKLNQNGKPPRTSKQDDWQCLNCDQRFKARSSLSKHISTHPEFNL